jgi:hypothetical protein
VCNALAILVSTLQWVGRNLQAMAWCSDMGQASFFACIKNGRRSVGTGGLKLLVLQRAFVSLKQVSRISIEILNTDSKTAPRRCMVSGGVTLHVLNLSGGT